jgi:hypothetical protein
MGEITVSNKSHCFTTLILLIIFFLFYIKTPENANLHRITTNITLMEESLMLMTRVINLVSVTYDDKLFCSTSVHSRFLLEFVQFLVLCVVVSMDYCLPLSL